MTDYPYDPYERYQHHQNLAANKLVDDTVILDQIYQELLVDPDARRPSEEALIHGRYRNLAAAQVHATLAATYLQEHMFNERDPLQ